MGEIKIIEGEIFKDHRGIISSLNDFRFGEVERFYFIHHPDASVVRGWHGHQHESKWFYCVKGEFELAFVKIDDWDNPSADLKPEIYRLKESVSRMVYVPEGHANCIRATMPDSVLLVFSGKIYSEAILDSWRYDKRLWVDWAHNQDEK